MAERPELSVPKTQLVRQGFFYCVIWGCELGYWALNPPAGQVECLGLPPHGDTVGWGAGGAN